MSRLKAVTDWLRQTVSSNAIARGAPGARFAITSKVGKPKTYCRHIIRHEEIPVLHADGSMTYRHRYLHATKGWREYAHGLPGVRR